MAKKYPFFNRELSWIEFNARVLEEARDKTVPLFERLHFLSIVTSNFDEFFMVRVASVKRLLQKNPRQLDSANLTPQAQLQKIALRVHDLVNTQYTCLQNELLPELSQNGIEYVPKERYTNEQKHFLKNTFLREIFPLLTPLRADEKRFPHVRNLSVTAIFLLRPLFLRALKNVLSRNKARYALVQIPESIPRIIWLSQGAQNSQIDKNGNATNLNKRQFALVDDVIQCFGKLLFPGFAVTESMLFRVTRDADFGVNEERSNDFIQAMEEVLQKRKSSIAVRLVCTNESEKLATFVADNLSLLSQDCYQVAGPLDLSFLNDITNLACHEHLLYPEWKSVNKKNLLKEDPFDYLKRQDLLLSHPYESYESVITFITRAAEDANVLAIKITLYRTSGNSPIVHALEKAARNGKHVTAFVELKARFDEERNIHWVNQLEQAGVIVVYGIANLKVHAKMLLVVRKELDGIKRYVHIATGNYNDKTARTYSDFSLFTSQQDISNDATLFFNMISGYSLKLKLQRLVMAPTDLEAKLISLIEREMRYSSKETPGLIMAKMNSLSHEKIIASLYRANNAGVHILLNVRGICLLVPGKTALSEHIKVVSIIDRYLEHARVFYFLNGGDEEVYLSSADWMPRNLERRVELMVPVLQKDIAQRLKKTLQCYFADNVKARTLLQDGTWQKVSTSSAPYRVQEALYQQFKRANDLQSSEVPLEFVVRRHSVQ